jgi:antitoxin (DNA-binding transcriptional repressor) of toxin-antitoxin stability system
MGSAVKSLYEAKTELSSLVDRASKGEEFVIAKNGVAMARLVPLLKAARQRKPGCWKGRVWIAEDFDVLPAKDLDRWEAGNVEPPAAPSTPAKRKSAGRR